MSILTSKKCGTCGEEKPLAEFGTYMDNRRKYGPYYNSNCKKCSVQRAKSYRSNLPSEVRVEREKWTRIWKTYRLRKNEYLELIADGCEVCGSKEKLCIDHDHSCCPGRYTCGRCIRGVLCSRHNAAEGMFESIEEIASLLAYCMKFTEKEEKI